MLIYEILNETITLANHTGNLTNMINRELFLCLRNEMTNLAQDGDTSNRGLDYFRESVLELVTENIESILARKTLEISGKRIPVKFTDIPGQGSLSDDGIELSNIMSRQLVKSVTDPLIEAITLGTITPKGIYEKLTEGSLEKYLSNIASSYIKPIVSTFLHEATHLKQITSQADGIEMEYRSYLEPNVEKFIASIGDMIASGDNKAEEVYYASPQEIAAFATTTASEFISDVSKDRTIWDDREKLVSSKTTILNTISGYIMDEYKGYFNKSDDKLRYSIFKRYIKILYKTVDDAIDKRVAQLSKKQRKI